jgi:hypothetical protein
MLSRNEEVIDRSVVRRQLNALVGIGILIGLVACAPAVATPATTPLRAGVQGPGKTSCVRN